MDRDVATLARAGANWVHHHAANWRYNTIQLTDDLLASLEHPGEVVTVRPPRESAGIDRARSFVDDFYVDDGPWYSFAPVFSNGRLSFWMSAPEGRRKDLSDAITSKYSGASLTDTDETLPIADREGEFAAGARVMYYYDSIRSLRTRHTHDPLDDDPHASILKRMTGESDETTMIQSCFQPISEGWFKRGWVGASGNTIADQLQDEEADAVFSSGTIQPDQRVNAGRDIQRQDGRDAFAVAFRVLATAPERSRAAQRVKDIVGALSAVKNAATQQKLTYSILSGSYLRDHVQMMARRDPDPFRGRSLISGHKQALTDEELGEFLLHLPRAEDVNLPMNWSEERDRERIPEEAY